MPDVPRMPASRRCFARIDRFECECPHCGRLIFAGIDRRHLPHGLLDTSRVRARAKERPRADSVLRLFWNPHTQRLRCPWCEHVYTLGIVFYPVQNRGRRVVDPAPDVVPTGAEVAEMRRLAGGWFVKGGKRVDDPANLVVSTGCSCPEQGTDPDCALHGQGTLTRPYEEAKVPRYRMSWPGGTKVPIPHTP